jgi:hypothetical protein
MGHGASLVFLFVHDEIEGVQVGGFGEQIMKDFGFQLFVVFGANP